MPNGGYLRRRRTWGFPGGSSGGSGPRGHLGSGVWALGAQHPWKFKADRGDAPGGIIWGDHRGLGPPWGLGLTILGGCPGGIIPQGVIWGWGGIIWGLNGAV